MVDIGMVNFGNLEIIFKSKISRSDTCTCGMGQQYRTIFCDRTPPNNERCDMRQTPNSYRECELLDDCVGEWFIGKIMKCKINFCY